MRVLLVATDAYGGHGGIALFNRQLCEALASDEGITEIVVIPRTMATAPDDVPAKVTFVADAAGGAFAYTRAIAAARRQTFDLVICGHINLLPVAAALGEPLLVIHGIDAWQPPRRKLASTFIGRCRGVVSVSAITRDRFVAWSRFAGKTFVLPNTIHTSKYGPRERRDDLVQRFGLASKRVLLTVGRLDDRERYKGFDEVISVLPELPDDVVYLIAGGGNDWERLRAHAIATGVGDRVIFTGIFPEEQKPDLYALADVYVMPSRGEGFGIVFLEALASGLPVIASKHDGGREALLNGELGLLVDPANPAEIAAAIREALTRTTRAIDSRLDYFSFENFARRIREITRSL